MREFATAILLALTACAGAPDPTAACEAVCEHVERCDEDGDRYDADRCQAACETDFAACGQEELDWLAVEFEQHGQCEPPVHALHTYACSQEDAE